MPALPPGELGGIRSRTVSRVFVVLGLLGLVAAWRLDQAVATAYRADWVALGSVEDQRRAFPFTCTNCLRLPNWYWVGVYAAIGMLALVFLAIAAFLFQKRHRGPRTPHGVRQLARGGGALVGLIAIADLEVRLLAASGRGRGYLAADTGLDAFALAVIAVIVVAAAAGSTSTIEGPYTLVRRVARFLQRQRVNVIGLALLTAALMFIGDTSGQAIDSIRTWGFNSWHSFARLCFGIGSTLLLSIVVYESAVKLTQVTRTEAKLWQPSWKTYAAIGGVFILFGALGVIFLPLGFGPIVFGAVVVMLGLLEIPRLQPKRSASEEVRAIQARYDDRVAEVLAVIPLLVVASTGVAAAIDAELSQTGWKSASPLIPTGLLVLAAILMTGERIPGRFDTPRFRWFVAAVAVVGVAALLLVRYFATSSEAAALLALGCGIVTVWYAAWLFRFQPPRAWTPESCCNAWSLPAAIAAGVGVLIAVHWKTFGSTDAIGTVALISLGLTFWLSVVNFLVYLSFRLRPPRALGYIGFNQLPVVTLLAIVWIGAGAMWSSPTIHEARLVERMPITTTTGARVIPSTPTLEQAFDTWVRSQPELRGDTPDKGTGPIPMFLIAAHGGGIRASYWTAIAIDCIVGVSAVGFDPGPVDSGDEKARRATCETQRRTKAQQGQAARRIFIASGVSGGAMGLYAYARQLISTGELGDGSWVKDRLGRDFASATIGWGLFHDVTNHWFGVHSHPGGGCGLHFRSVCLSTDRAAIEEEAFDRVWPKQGFPPLLRLTWDLRSSGNANWRNLARMVPLLITNATVTGGKTRALVSAADLGSWPKVDSYDPGRGDFDTHPLAGNVEAVDAACRSRDLWLSTAALLGSRFPFVSPSGHLTGHCRGAKDEDLGADKSSPCAQVKVTVCEMRLVDGGYVDNSGLFTIDAIWPSLRQLVFNFNKSSAHPIAPVIVELDNHYQAGLAKSVAAASTTAETLVPPLTAFGARNSMETYARALAYRLRPEKCVVTISPRLHPGLTAPLGWELSQGAQGDLRAGLISPLPTALEKERFRQVKDLRRLQQWLGSGNEPSAGLGPNLETCVPTETFPTRP